VQRSPQLADLPESESEAPPGDEALTDGARLWDDVAAQLDIEAIVLALDHLTDLQREVLALRFGAELSIAEAAAWMGRSESAVKNLQYAALGAIKAQLQEGGNGR
jgi:DNA-directed RNA polymerase specialized sigma24 family protein